MATQDTRSSRSPRLTIPALLGLAAMLAPAWTGRAGHAQPPTTQDCPGAIPVCQPIFTQANGPPAGQGNVLNELHPQSCLATGEVNDVWYVFTVQTAGNLSFVINPNNPQNDYDWAVYDLTAASCGSIATDLTLETSCNFSGRRGPTGPTGGTGPTFNPTIPVQAGETYAVNVSNYSANAVGYTLDFTASTASIFDDVRPRITAVASPMCDDATIDVTFSELILCSTVEPADFQVVGPGGPYTVTQVAGGACGIQGRSFQLTTSPPLSQAGSYDLCLVPDAGSVADLCGNLATPRCVTFPFTPSSPVSVTASSERICPGESVTLNADGDGDIVWAPGGQTGHAITVSPGRTTTYSALLTDPQGCTASASVTVEVSDLAVEVGDDVVSCAGDQTWELAATATGGASHTGPVLYEWSHGATGPTTSVPATDPGAYLVTVTDAEGCTASDRVEVLLGDPACRFRAVYDTPTALPAVTQRQDSILAGGPGPVTVEPSDVVVFRAGRVIHLRPGFEVKAGGYFQAEIGPCAECTRPQVEIELSRADTCSTTMRARVTGGTPPYSYAWSDGLGSGASATVSSAQTETHTVTVTDAAGLTQSASAVVEPTGFWGSFPRPAPSPPPYLSWPNALRRSAPSGSLAGRLSIYHFDPPNVPDAFLLDPAYNADRFQLQVFDRWGNVIYVKDEQSDAGFRNGSIFWEGYTNVPYGDPNFSKLVYEGPIHADSATKVQFGVYNWKLLLWNCSHPAFPAVATPRAVTVVP